MKRFKLSTRLTSPKLCSCGDEESLSSRTASTFASVYCRISRVFSFPMMGRTSSNANSGTALTCPPLRPVAPEQIARASKTVMCRSSDCDRRCRAILQPDIPEPMIAMSVFEGSSGDCSVETASLTGICQYEIVGFGIGRPGSCFILSRTVVRRLLAAAWC